MNTPRRGRVAAATALALVALGAPALGQAAGTMILPDRSVGKRQLKPGAVTAAKVRNGTLTSADFKAGTLLAGPQGPKGDAGPAGAPGPQGDRGPAGAAGTARAYARVQCDAASGKCRSTRAFGVSGVTLVFPGLYCVTVPGVDANVVPALAGVDAGLTTQERFASATTTSPADISTGDACPHETDFIVITYRAEPVQVDKAGTGQPITVMGAPNYAGDVAFTFVVP